MVYNYDWHALFDILFLLFVSPAKYRKQLNQKKESWHLCRVVNTFTPPFSFRVFRLGRPEKTHLSKPFSKYVYLER